MSHSWTADALPTVSEPMAAGPRSSGVINVPGARSETLLLVLVLMLLLRLRMPTADRVRYERHGDGRSQSPRRSRSAIANKVPSPAQDLLDTAAAVERSRPLTPSDKRRGKPLTAVTRPPYRHIFETDTTRVVASVKSNIRRRFFFSFFSSGMAS